MGISQPTVLDHPGTQDKSSTPETPGRYHCKNFLNLFFLCLNSESLKGNENTIKLCKLKSRCKRRKCKYGRHTMKLRIRQKTNTNISIYMVVVGRCISLLEFSSKVSETGWYKQQKWMFSQFWRSKVQDQSIPKVGSFRGFLTFLPVPLWVA